VFVELSYYFPFVFMQVVSALERMDPTLEECARIAGARQGTVIWKITLPLVKPAISAGALLILISSLAHFGVPSILGFSQGIYTLPILVAYMARYLSFSMKTSSAALLQVHPSLEEAARACGASHTESLKDVTLPLIRPAMVSGFFLIFLPAMREVTTSVLLYGPYTRTLGVQIYSLRDAGMMPQAAALGSVAIAIIIICNTVVTQLTKDRKGV